MSPKEKKKADESAEAPVVSAPLEEAPKLEKKEEKKKEMSPPEPEPEVQGTPAPKIRFSMYCQIKKIPRRWRPGMRAFTKVEYATEAEWDEIFKAY